MQRVVLCIYCSLLKSCVKLAGVDRCRKGSHCLPGSYLDLVRQNPHLDSLHVVWCGYRSYVVGQLTEAVLPDGKTYKAYS